MRFNGLDLNLLVALDALLTERNVSRAAKRVFVSQPAMSNALARLRDYFGDELIVRSGRDMLLTARAEALIGPLQDILSQIDGRLVAPSQFDPASAQNSFTLSASDYTTSVLVQPLLQKLAHLSPGLRFKLIAQEWPNTVAHLERGDMDLLITPLQFVSPQHPQVVLFEEDYVCVTWSGSTRFKGGLGLDVFKSAGHVAASFDGGRAPAADTALLALHGIERRVEVVANSLLSPAELVVGTDRVATVHRRLAVRAARYLPLRLWPVPVEIPRLVEHLQWNRVYDASPALRWVIAQCREVASEI
ncbi:LysR family transcriptional regulator [Denitromonas iodatirespirans]|uniref:LysR family transcriptional regulator n=1 Tax=Denitromonas iodatirespirans TaxID=2795389 RepID=A0A944D501_DENI1|nr:LysR family transcriptional regulator [Denitromonas iodatirespirans]MBT0960105.1 LysR family transcriptional regulator [Denitromonas iodatirespirans]